MTNITDAEKIALLEERVAMLEVTRAQVYGLFLALLERKGGQAIIKRAEFDAQVDKEFCVSLVEGSGDLAVRIERPSGLVLVK